MGKCFSIIGVSLLLLLPSVVGAQTTTIRGATKGTSTPMGVTATSVDANHNALDVNIAAGGGTGGGPADAAANAAASESDTARQKVTSAIRLYDTGAAAGSQLVTAKGDQTSGLWVNCKAGCSGAAADTTQTNTINASGAYTALAVAGDNGLAVQFDTGTLAGATIVVQVSTDGGTTYSNALFTDMVTGAVSTSLSNPSNVQYGVLFPNGGISHMRLNATAYTSGSVVAHLRATAIRPSTVLYGTDGTNLQAVKTSTAGNLIVMPATGTGTALFPVPAASADNVAAQTSTYVHSLLSGWDSAGGNWDRLLLDASGNLKVNVVTGGGGGVTDNSAFTFGTTSVSGMGAVVDDTATNTVTENNIGHVRMSTNAILYSNPTNNAGASLFPSAAALADATSNPTTTGLASYNMCFNGTTWDRCVKATAGAGTVDANTQRITIGTDDSLVTGLLLSQGSTTSGQKGSLHQAAVTTAAPTYTTGQTSPLSLTTAGALRVDNSAVTQPTSLSSITALTGSGSLAALNDIVTLTVGGYGACGVDVSGTWVGTITFQASVDGTTYGTASYANMGDSRINTTTTSNGSFLVNCAGLHSIRTKMTAYTSGTATIAFRAVPSASKMVTVAGGYIHGIVAKDITTSSVNPLTTGCYASTAVPSNVSSDGNANFTWCLQNGLTTVNLRNASGTEIATSGNPLRIDPTGTTAQPASQSGNWTSRIVGNAGGVMDAAGQNASSPANELLIAGQFNTTPTTITSGNVSPIQLDSSGNIKVNVVAGGGGGGPSDAAASAAASESDTARQKVTAALRLYDTGQSAGSQLVTAKGDQTNGLWVNCKSGCSGSSFTDNSAFTFGTSTITNIGAVVDDTATNTVTENNAGHVRMSTNAILYANPTNSAGTSLFSNAGALNTDGVAVPTTTSVGAILYGFNGSTFDRLTVDASKYLQVHVAAFDPSITVIGGPTGSLSTMGALNATVSMVSGLDSDYYVDLSGTWVGTVSFMWAPNGGSYAQTGVCRNLSTNALVGTTTSNGTFVCPNLGAAGFQTKMTSYTSGTATAALSAQHSTVHEVALNAPLPTGSNTIGAVTQASGPWTSNITQFGSNNVVTGTGASGVGIPRVTISNDSSLAANQSVNVNQIGGSAVTTLAAGEQKVGVEGLAASGASKSGNPVQVGGVFNTTQPTVTTGQMVEAQATARGGLIVSTGVDTFNVTVNAALPTGANTIGAVTQASGPWTQNLTQVASTTLGAPQTFGTAPTGVVIGTSSDLYVAGTRARSNQATTAAGVLDVNIVGSLGATNSATNGTFTRLTDNTTAVGVIAATTALKTDMSSVGGTAVTVGADNAANSSAKLPVLPGRANAAAPTWTEGNQVPMSFDLSGNLRVNSTGGGVTDGSAFTAGSSTESTGGGVYNDTLAAATSGTTVATRSTPYRAVHQNLRGADGQEVGTRTNPLTVQLAGVSAINNSSPLADPSQATVVTLDAFGMLRSTSTIGDGSGRYASLRGLEGAQALDAGLVVHPSIAPALQCPYVVPINQTANTQLVTANNKSAMICALSFVAAAAMNISLVEGTGTTCGTGTLGLYGGSSASVAVAANGGVVLSGDRITLPTQTRGNNVCLLQSAASNVSGFLTYGLY